jgi:hypothetical protein
MDTQIASDMDANTIRYLKKKSGSDNKATQYEFVLKIADWFRKESQQSIKVGRNFIAEVPPELDNFIENEETEGIGALID